MKHGLDSLFPYNPRQLMARKNDTAKAGKVHSGELKGAKRIEKLKGVRNFHFSLASINRQITQSQ